MTAIASSLETPAMPRSLFVALSLVAVTVIVAAPLLAPNTYVIKIAIVALIFAAMSQAFNLIYGFAGQLSFAQAGFWGVGAYVSAIGSQSLGLSPWLCLLIAPAICAVVAVLVGVPALRVSRAAFVIVTLALTLLLQLLARNWTEVTRGAMGIPGLPPLSISIPGVVNLDGADPFQFYWIALMLIAPVLALLYSIMSTRMGKILLATNQDESLARSQGMDVSGWQLFAFVISGAVSGFVGALYAFHLSIVEPGIFDMYYTQILLIIVIAGGAGHFWSVLGASLVFTALPEMLRVSSEWRLVIFGVLLAAIIIVMPRGFGGYLEDRRLRLWRRRA